MFTTKQNALAYREIRTSAHSRWLIELFCCKQMGSDVSNQKFQITATTNLGRQWKFKRTENYFQFCKKREKKKLSLNFFVIKNLFSKVEGIESQVESFVAEVETKAPQVAAKVKTEVTKVKKATAKAKEVVAEVETKVKKATAKKATKTTKK